LSLCQASAFTDERQRKTTESRFTNNHDGFSNAIDPELSFAQGMGPIDSQPPKGNGIVSVG
jgi:hypothetical protein